MRGGRAVKVAVLMSCALACERTPGPTPVAAEPEERRSHREENLQRASVEQPSPTVSQELRWVAFGGGSDPLSNQVSLAQDVDLVRRLLAGPGLVLFGSGTGTPLAVQRPTASSTTGAGDGHLTLAQFLGAPDGEHTDYRNARTPIDGPATSEHVREVLRRAVSRAGDPLLVYAACHGSRGEAPADNRLDLWGGWGLTVRDVAQLLDDPETPRPTRFVITSCFGGAFADVIFQGADPARGLREGDVCGLFATTADEEASGCDPNPDRRAQDSYSIHFLQALEGRDRKSRGRKQEIDLNGDGQVDLLEAHTWARIEGRSFDVPTTTSERYLRETLLDTSTRLKLNPEAAQEEAHLIQVLGADLALETEQAAQSKLSELERILQDSGALVEDAQKDADDSYYALRIALIERWPLLEHPWEARTQAMLRREHGSIQRMLNESDLAQTYAQAEREVSEAMAQHENVRVARARVQRLVRAFETLRLASAAYARGGTVKARYRALRHCEHFVPKLATQLGHATAPPAKPPQ